MADKRVIIANPDEPATGQNGFDLYDQIRPGFSRDKSTMDNIRKNLRGLRGQEVTLTVKGERISPGGRRKGWTGRRTFALDEFDDFLDAYLSTLKGTLKMNSNWKLVTTTLTIEPASGTVDY